MRPHGRDGRIDYYSLWERVFDPNTGEPRWVERSQIAQDEETLREKIPEFMAERLAVTRSTPYSIAAYDRLVMLLLEAFNARGIPARAEGRVNFAKEIARAIIGGEYTTALDPANKVARDVFSRFTLIALPKQIGKTMEVFTGQPFHVVVDLADSASPHVAAPVFDEKEWRRFYYTLAGKLLAAAKADVDAARKRRDEGARYEADRQVQAATLLRKFAMNEDVIFARLHATWHDTWADVGMPATPVELTSLPLSPLPQGMKPNRRPR